MTDPRIPEDDWPEALATVTACRYDFGAERALAFGIPVTRHFRIAYNYNAAGDVHEGEFASEVAIAQGGLFPVRFNPEAPQEHRREGAV